MATVYLAEDRKHKRRVALKVLSPELAAAVGAERFLREIELAAQLSHPHVMPLHDSGEADGRLYYVMPYIEGETLRSRLNRERTIALDDAARIVAEVADALDYAHRRGVVHRDIKPENILLSGYPTPPGATPAWHAIVADFGVGKALGGAAGSSLTQVGFVLGTPEYMSLEQAAGDNDVDGRSDIYSLGVVLYEMLVGRTPFTANSAAAVLGKRFAEGVPSIRDALPTISMRVDQVAAKAMAKEPSDRWNTAGEMSAALMAAAAEGPGARERMAAADRSPSIAVLPFANMSTDPENEFFSDGITEEILNALAQLPSLHVAARTSAFAFKGKNVDLRTVGEQLGVATVLEGSVRRAGTRIRIAAQLVDVSTGFHLWSERYDRELADVFAVQDEIANAIVKALQIKLFGADCSCRAPSSTDIQTYELYLKGRFFLNQHGVGALKALELFRHAIARDPNYAPAHMGVADCYSVLVGAAVMRPTEGYPRARAAAQRALELDETFGEARSTLGVIALLHDWDRETARREILVAIELDPNAVYSQMRLCFYHVAMAQWQSAIDAGRKAVSLDPLAIGARYGLALAYLYGRRDRECIAECIRVAELFPDYADAYWCMSVALTRLGEQSDAIEAASRAVDVSKRNPMSVSCLALAYASAGQADESRALIAELETRAAAGEFVPQVFVGLVHLALGDVEHAIDCLELAVLQRDAWTITVPVNQTWDPIRTHPRFIDLIMRTGIAEGLS